MKKTEALIRLLLSLFCLTIGVFIINCFDDPIVKILIGWVVAFSAYLIIKKLQFLVSNIDIYIILYIILYIYINIYNIILVLYIDE